jgi:hypothetical protein
MMDQSGAEKCKLRGNEEFKKSNIGKAVVEHYSQGIELDPRSHILFSYRCACYIIQQDWVAAEADALQRIKISAGFAKGQYRPRITILESK